MDPQKGYGYELEKSTKEVELLNQDFEPIRSVESSANKLLKGWVASGLGPNIRLSCRLMAEGRLGWNGCAGRFAPVRSLHDNRRQAAGRDDMRPRRPRFTEAFGQQ